MVLIYKEQISGLHFVIIIDDNPFKIIDYICVEMTSEEEMRRFIEKAYSFKELSKQTMPTPEILRSINRQERRHHCAYDRTRYKRKRKGEKYYEYRKRK